MTRTLLPHPRRGSGRALPLLAVLGLVASLAAGASAQTLPGLTTTKQDKLERLGENHVRFTGKVEFRKDDLEFYADQVDYFTDTNQVIATGDVVFVSKENRIAADRLDFNTETRLGRFEKASGTARLTQDVDRSMFGTQEPEAYFYGEAIDKIGPDKYRITKGGFTTCLQPTPRWEVSASTITMTLEEYAVVRNAILKVKNVPMFYLPIFYYPVQEDDRATGFLIPVYGSSTIRGQSLSNAFFWAINRSQDATIMHDWYSQTGQGVGGEYRYIAGQGSEGSLKTYFLKETQVLFPSSDDETETGRRSYELRGRMTQRLPGNLRARADVDYFSNVTTQQLYQTNLYQATLRQRSYGGNVGGSWGADSVSGTFSIRELFLNDDDSVVYGNAPRFSYSRAPRRLFGSPVYFSFGSEFNKQVQTYRRTDTEDRPQGLTRVDFSPQVRAPLSRWPFLGLQASLAFRQTYYSESFNEEGRRVQEWIGRRYFDMRGEVTGPTFTRIFDTNNRFAEKIKHVIEPNVSIQRTSLIENYDRLVKLDSYDFTLGGTTRINYGLTNRFLLKQKGTGPQASAREFASLAISQTYYSDEAARDLDPSYAMTFRGLDPQKLSPWQVSGRLAPTANVDYGVRLEYDQYEKRLLSIGMSGRVGYKDVYQTTAGWSRQKITETFENNYWTTGTSVRLFRGRLGGFFGFDYDFFRDRMLQRRVQGFYNAQCCGIAMEYQVYNYSGLGFATLIPQDRRFNLTFTLAGIGTFANVFGAFGNPDPSRVR